MKKWRWNALCILLTVIFASVCICACSKKESGPRTVIHNGKSYTIDKEAKTISDGKYIYRYEVQGNGSSVGYKFIYPNGSYYHWTKSNNVGYGGWSEDYDKDLYVSGDTLLYVLEKVMPEESEPKNVPVIVVLLLVGIFNAASPETAWYLSDGWKYKNAEPSEEALGLTRVGGIVAIVIGVFMILA